MLATPNGGHGDTIAIEPIRHAAMRRRLKWPLCGLIWGVLLICAADAGFCASFSGIVVTDSEAAVPGATVQWQNHGVCVSRGDPDGSVVCYPPTVSGSATTALDGSFAANNLPADTYSICVNPVAANQLPPCEWPGDTGPTSITLTANQNVTGLTLILRTGSLVAITVNDPQNALSKNFFSTGVIVGSGGYYGAPYNPSLHAYTRLVPKGIPVHLFFDTLLIVQDGNGISQPIDTSVLPFTTGADQIPISITVMPVLVNTASNLPGVDEGAIATLLGSGFTSVPGVDRASSLPLPTNILGTSVTVNGIAAPLLVVASQNGQDQINFQVPHLPVFGTGSGPDLIIVVENNGRTQTFYSIERDGQVGVFSTLTAINGNPITTSSPARPREQITIYWTGMSGYNFEYSPGVFYIPDGIPSPPGIPCVSYFNSQVQIGGIPAEVRSCTAAPGLVGIGQLEVIVPPGLASGDYRVVVTLTNVTGNVVQLPVQSHQPDKLLP